MKNLFLVALLVVSTLAAGSASGQTSSQKVRDSMIVSTEWLARHLDDDSLVLLQIGEKGEYEAGHIPRAQYIALADISTPRGEGLSLQLPPAIQLKAVFEKLGVSDDSRIVLYFSKDWVTPTTRVFFTLDYLGLGERTSILDGGLPAWVGEGRPVTTEVSSKKVGHLDKAPKPELVVDANWVRNNLQTKGVKLLDARAPQFYSGVEAGRMPRGGRIPGALSIPFSVLVDEKNKFKSADMLLKLFTEAGVAGGDRVATYCHTGQQASLLYFAARYLGFNSQLYDGSFEEWSKTTELPVEKTEIKPQ
jgi:thiosulfate/3-mercaptopyruvate sulfurtransferase